ncbi:MAG: J domain-containing protein [Deltaproteobacteria bacterium]|nr:J domain-containing protein [Deltaproteobacteria bacterium]MBW2070853.1 J domain-containing protein [Deltaproteobacteria bacterium]
MKQLPFSFADIDRARRLLGLEERASIREIKAAYRRLCKEWHPDRQRSQRASVAKMQDLNAAYRLLLDYCQLYPCSFVQEKVEKFDPEKWWFRRFGNNIRSRE